ncbi:zinc ribbon domain-containing protein [Chloroflexota bacterium]
METKIYHGSIKAKDLAQALTVRFNRTNLMANTKRSGDQYIVQIASRRDSRSGGKTALGITIQQLEEGVAIKLGKQSWLGIAASIGTTLLAARRNPFNLLGRLDDVAQDIENINLDDQVWDVIEEVATTMGASQQLSERLRRTGCEYCETANPVGQPRCLACGAPLGGSQPRLCSNCGFVAAPEDIACTNCGEALKT